MIKKLLLAICFTGALTAKAVEVQGIKLQDSVQVGDNTLVLNGAGVRTKLVFKVYVAALYVAAKHADAAQVLTDSGVKRVSLHMLRSLSAEKLLHAMDEGLEANNTKEELAAIEPQLKAFRQHIEAGGALKEGDVIVLDYLPSKGTQTSLNGKSLGVTEGAAFNTALLRVWLGEKPVDADLKKAMLGNR